MQRNTQLISDIGRSGTVQVVDDNDNISGEKILFFYYILIVCKMCCGCSHWYVGINSFSANREGIQWLGFWAVGVFTWERHIN